MGFTGGHTHANWGDPNQRKVLLNALLWLAKVDVPARGVADKITEADLNRGQERFNIYCAPCHDSTGGGQGMVVRRGYRQPPSFPERHSHR